MIQRRLLSPAEFARASARTRMEPSTLAIARAVLVEGKQQVEVAASAGTSRAWVSEAVAKFMRRVEDAERLSLPTGWRTDTVALPSDLWPEVRKLERDARARLKNSGTSFSAAQVTEPADQAQSPEQKPARGPLR